jgi:hypothetical protein
VVIHVLADLNATQAERDEYLHGEHREPPAEPAAPEPEPEAAPEPPVARPAECRPTPAAAPAPVAEREPAAPSPINRGRAVILGGAVIPPSLLAELIATGARLTPVPAAAEDPEPRYRPSTALDQFVRMRDMTCRYPGCQRPATFCDLDHGIAWPAGATHASNLSPKCRRHHLLKTFWTGFTDRQHPDGTIEFTTPTGHCVTTRPGSALLFPGWDTATKDLGPPPPTPPATPGRTVKMPTRKQPRAKTEQQRRKAERALNDPLPHDKSPPY